MTRTTNVRPFMQRIAFQILLALGAMLAFLVPNGLRMDPFVPKHLALALSDLSSPYSSTLYEQVPGFYSAVAVLAKIAGPSVIASSPPILFLPLAVVVAYTARAVGCSSASALTLSVFFCGIARTTSNTFGVWPHAFGQLAFWAALGICFRRGGRSGRHKPVRLVLLTMILTALYFLSYNFAAMATLIIVCAGTIRRGRGMIWAPSIAFAISFIGTSFIARTWLLSVLTRLRSDAISASVDVLIRAQAEGNPIFLSLPIAVTILGIAKLAMIAGLSAYCIIAVGFFSSEHRARLYPFLCVLAGLVAYLGVRLLSASFSPAVIVFVLPFAVGALSGPPRMRIARRQAIISITLAALLAMNATVALIATSTGIQPDQDFAKTSKLAGFQRHHAAGEFLSLDEFTAGWFALEAVIATGQPDILHRDASDRGIPRLLSGQLDGRIVVLNFGNAFNSGISYQPIRPLGQIPGIESTLGTSQMLYHNGPLVLLQA